ncbi:adenylosuccinate lyase [Hippea maritima]|uniref:Adenylosuccinate lyase n=1 Tax=Hippea maritima (strain ATCC 700847 / DSM 10411 / MH2) TaxID=760142 RepID=F2LTK0_HIPMA|nr:adenylosuccinate lyase [Hippea maritima]AEA33325.1 adenylosuccinate lyase [Hippea maritima DSM 10411]
MIERYTRKEMGQLWTEEAKFSRWLEVEIAVVEGWESIGEIPKGTAERIKQNAKFSIKRIEEIERVTRHDVVAFLENVKESLGDEGDFLHFGITSSDTIDTAMALALKRSAEIIIEDIKMVMDTLKKRAFEFKDTLMIGRSHGIHGEPISFGFVLALWYAEMKRNLKRMEDAKEAISYGKISGSMGTFANVPLEVEEYACKKLGLKPAPISSQIIQRDRYAQYMTTLAIVASTIEKIATQIRHYQRTEVREAEEFFHKGQKGSSSMPHKRNPVLSENLCGLARLVRSNSIAALENVALWHERDISHSSNERIILPDSNIAMDFMLYRLNNVIENLTVYEENMIKNLNLTRGVIYSQRLMLRLVEKGADKIEAYEAVQRNAMDSWENEKNFKELVLSDGFIKKYLTKEETEECFNPNYYIRRMDNIFSRVFDE